MAEKKFLDYIGLQDIVQRFFNIFAKTTELESHTNDSDSHLTSTLKDKITTAYIHSQESHAPSTAEENVIVGIQKNGEDVTVDSETRKVNITTPTFTVSEDNMSVSIADGDLSANIPTQEYVDEQIGNIEIEAGGTNVDVSGDFIVNLIWTNEDDTVTITADKTYAETYQAFQDGKNIYFSGTNSEYIYMDCDIKYMASYVNEQAVMCYQIIEDKSYQIHTLVIYLNSDDTVTYYDDTILLRQYDVINNFTSTETQKPLSANKGRELYSAVVASIPQKKDIVVENVPLTTLSNNASYYGTVISFDDLGVNYEDIIGIVPLNWAGSEASFSLYLHYSQGVNAFSDISQTVSMISFRVIYQITDSTLTGTSTLPKAEEAKF